MNIQDVIEKIEAHSREIEKLENERVELDRADLPRDAHNRNLEQIVSYLDKETKARAEQEEIVRAYNTMKDNIEAIRRISDIPTNDFYERDEKNREIEARRAEIIKAREMLPPELVASLHEEILRADQKSETAVITQAEVNELEEEVYEQEMEVKGNDEELEENRNYMEEKINEEVEPRNNEVYEKDNEYVEVVPETEFVEIEEVQVDMNAIIEEYNGVVKEIIGYIQTNNAKLNSLNLHKERLEEERAAIGANEENRAEIEKEYDRQIAETERAIRAITNPSKEDELRIRREKDELYRLATSKIQKVEAVIEELKRENRRLEYEHSEMVHNGITDHAKWHHLTNKINDNTYKIRKLNEVIEKYKGLKEELRKTEKVIDLSRGTGVPTPPPVTDGKTGDGDSSKPGTDTSDDTGAEAGDDETTTDEEEPEDDKKIEPTLDAAIEAIKNKLNPETLTPEAIKDLIEKMVQLVILKYEQEQALFEKELSEAKTVKEKIQIIDKREVSLIRYIQLMSHESKEIDELLAARRTEVANFVNTSYETAKRDGEYCWKESKAIKESIRYIESVLGNDKDWNPQFATLLDNMEEIIKNPDQEQYENWRAGMQQFAERLKLNPDKMLPYMNARAKLVNPNVSVDNEFNLHGLNLDNTKGKGQDGGPTPPRKPRRKVTKVEDAKGFFKKHPKLKLVAIGLGILLGSQLGLAGLMMINSTLWSVLGGQGAICGILHAINLGLSKIVGVGLFQFTQAGTYTFLGKAGALALYNAVGAKLTAAAAALGGIGALIAKKIKNKNEKKKSWLKEKLSKLNWFKKNDDEELDEEFEDEFDEEELDEEYEDDYEEEIEPIENNEELLRQILNREEHEKNPLSLRNVLKAIMEHQKVTSEEAIEIYKTHNYEVERIMEESEVTREEAIEFYLEEIKEQNLGEDAPKRNR